MENPTTPGGTSADQPAAGIPKSRKNLLIGGAIVLILLLAIGGLIMAKSRGERDKNLDTAAIEDAARRDEEQRQRSSSDRTGNPDPKQQSTNTSSRFLMENGQNCVDRKVTFTHSTIPDDQLGYIEPMGKVNDGHVTPTDHMYMHPIKSQVPDNSYDAIMPADGTVVAIGAMPAQYVGDTNQQAASEDHRITVMHSCQYFSIYIHVHKLDPALTAVVGKLEPNTSKTVSINLKAGDKIGKIGGQGHDWTLVDTTQTLSGFITPSLYEGESWKIHAIDPLSVYTGDKKTKYEALSMRSAAPLGGKIDLDKKGALVGNWFRDGTKGYSDEVQGEGRYWDGHLSVVPDYVDPDSTVVSIGNWTGQAAQFAVKGTADPSSITKASGPVKYELIKLGYVTASGRNWTGNEPFAKGIKVNKNGAIVGTILLEVQDSEKLKVEKFAGKTAAQVNGFTSAAQSYYR